MPEFLVFSYKQKRRGYEIRKERKNKYHRRFLNQRKMETMAERNNKELCLVTKRLSDTIRK